MSDAACLRADASGDAPPKIMLNATPIAAAKTTPTAALCMAAPSAAPKHRPRPMLIAVPMRVMKSLEPEYHDFLDIPNMIRGASSIAGVTRSV